MFLAVVLWGISRLPEPDSAPGGVGAKILQDLQASHRPTGLSFPDFLGEMKRGDIKNYEKQEKGLGLGIHYNGSSQIWATIYVYDLRLRRIPQNVWSEEFIAHFSQVEGDIFEAEKTEVYNSVQKLFERVDVLGTTVSGPQARSARFSYTIAPDKIPIFSHLYLAAYRNHFFKIRFSYPQKQEAEGTKILAKFLDDVGRLLIESSKID
jgi:hypothetical protein